MNDFPQLRDPKSLTGRLLVLAAHPDDEVLGCGGVIALAARAGAQVRVLVASDGAADHSGAERTQHAKLRAEESRRGGAHLGVRDFVFADLPDGRLGEQWGLTERLQREIEAFAPDWVLAPSPLELHADHLALATAAAAALAHCPAQRALLYGVNTPVVATVLFDVSAAAAAKRAALLEFVSQGGVELADKSAAMELARTINVADPSVKAIEGFVEVVGVAALEYARRARSLTPRSGQASASGASNAQDPFAATAVIT